MRLSPLPMCAGALLLTGSCASGVATADNPAFSRAVQAHVALWNDEVLTRLGGRYRGSERFYVETVGRRIAPAATSAVPCRFEIINSPSLDAFALPGCYVYVTRGLLGTMNSEAELAAILAHALGHLAAGHRAPAENLAAPAGFAALLDGLEGRARVAAAASEAALGKGSYAQAQEAEANTRARQYLTAAGYPADSLSTSMRTIFAVARLRSGAGLSGATGSHHLMLAAQVAKVARDSGTQGKFFTGRVTYLNKIDGLLFGEDPAKGFVERSRYTNPGLGISFEAPPGFSLTTTSSGVLIYGPANIRAQFGGGPLIGRLDVHAADLMSRILGDVKGAIEKPHHCRVHGVGTTILRARVRTSAGSARILVAAYQTAPGRAYHLAAVVPGGANIKGVEAMISSFTILKPGDAPPGGTRRIDIVRVRPGDTTILLAERMAVSGRPTAWFNALNGRKPGQPLRIGERVKIVVYAHT